MLELKKVLENNNIDNKYHVGTFRDNEEDIKNEKNIKSIKAALNYIDKFNK